MTRSEAQRITKRAIKKQLKIDERDRKNQIKVIYSRIKTRAKDGYNQYSVSDLYPETIQQLKEDGFSIEYYSMCKIISWN